jgi:hypothetical protein
MAVALTLAGKGSPSLSRSRPATTRAKASPASTAANGRLNMNTLDSLRRAPREALDDNLGRNGVHKNRLITKLLF